VGYERRHRDAQRESVDEALPEDGDGSLLRMAGGQVLVYDESLEKRRPVALRAVVLPDGELLTVARKRFGRGS
jgi:hypothetical protein